MLAKKHLSEAQKRKRQRETEKLIESQTDALHKFFSTPSSVVPNDNVVDATDIEEEG
jgi:hypothetical protein